MESKAESGTGIRVLIDHDIEGRATLQWTVFKAERFCWMWKTIWELSGYSYRKTPVATPLLRWAKNIERTKEKVIIRNIRTPEQVRFTE
jgi:hypothetical protein